MSLINQMLRDLDRQRGPAGGAEVVALRGLGLVDPRPSRRTRIRPLVGGVLAVAAAVALGYWTADKLSDKQTETVATTSTADAPASPAPEPAQPPHTPNRLKETPGVTDNQQPVQPVQAPPPTVVAALPATRQQIPAAPRLGAIASIEAKPTADPTPVANRPVAKQPTAEVRTLSPAQKAERLYNQAQQALQRHRSEAAIALLEQALAEDRRHTAAREQLAMFMIQKRQPAQAEAVLAEGLAFSPERIELAHLYARLLAERGALVPALETLQQLATRQPADAETLALQAGIMARLNRHTDAARTYRQALRQQPHQSVWWTGLGVALEHEGRATTALNAYRRALQLPLQDDVRHFVQQRIRALAGLDAETQG